MGLSSSMSLLASNLTAGYTCTQDGHPRVINMSAHAIPDLLARMTTRSAHAVHAAQGNNALCGAPERWPAAASLVEARRRRLTLTQRLRASSAFLACM